MSNAFKSKPIPPDTLIFDLAPSRFLRPEDLIERWKVTHLAVTISRLAMEETIPSMKDIDPQTRQPKVVESPVLYFKTKSGSEFPRGMLISAKENTNAIREATGVKTTGDLIGKRITIILGEHRKKPVLRIDPTPVQQDDKPAPAAKKNADQNPLETLKAQADDDVITAFTNICEAAGLDLDAKNAILRECGGDFDVAFNKVVEQYKEVLT